MKALGLPELLSHLRARMPLDEAIAAAQRATRRYAKRQMTWFRHQMTSRISFLMRNFGKFAALLTPFY